MLVAFAVFLAALLGAVAAVLIVHLVAAARNAVPPVLTPPEAVAEVLRELKLPVRGKLVDLGCGDGRVLAAALMMQPALEAVGVENNPVMLARAKLRLKGRARLVLGDILKQSLRGTDRVFVYLGPGLMAELEPRFERELPKGARVVSQQYPLPNRKPVRVVQLAHAKPYAKQLFVYDY
jgi:SAM-dependent methyltransferase